MLFLYNQDDSLARPPAPCDRIKLPIYQIDAFAGHLFSGNPAAVVFPKSELPSETMQAIAAENNLAETAFVVSDGENIKSVGLHPKLK